jgi:hypothetical protein
VTRAKTVGDNLDQGNPRYKETKIAVASGVSSSMTLQASSLGRTPSSKDKRRSAISRIDLGPFTVTTRVKGHYLLAIPIIAPQGAAKQLPHLCAFR